MPRGQKQCPSCDTFVATRVSLCECGHTFKKKKKAEKPTINKQKILERLVIAPKDSKRVFYKREMKHLNELVDRYSLEFMNVVNFYRQFDSLSYLVSPKLKETLDKKFRAFNYVVDETRYPEYNIRAKSGKDRVVEKKRKTLKDFLDEK